MQKKITLLLLTAFFLISGYYIREHFFKKQQETNKKLNKQDRIDLAVQQEFKATKDPALGRIPKERLIDATSVRDERLAQIANARAVAGLAWQERGPSNVGGRTRAILYDAGDAVNGYKKVWAGSVAGGLWYTNDITISSPQWHQVNDFMGNLAITTLAQNPANTQEIYAGTGEGWFNSDNVQGLGIWKSSDGGATWAQLGSTNNSNFYFVQKIVVTATGIVLACTRTNGLYRSTDGGVNWTKVLGAGVGAISNRAADIEIAANGDIYCAMGIFSTDGIYRSVNSGASWTNIYASAADEERIELACAPSNADIIYALVQDNNAPNPNGIKKIMRTTDATGATPTWNTLTNPSWCDQGSGSTDFTRTQAWYDLIAAVDPADANTVYIGGVDMLKTTDGGTNWSQISQWATSCTSGSYVHADIHNMLFNPGSSSELIVGCDGGIFRTTDAGANFSHRNKGYNVTQYYAAAIHPTLTNYFLAGAQDNGTQRFSVSGINSTSQATGGDGGFCHIDQDNGNIQISSYVFNNYFVSTDGGASFISRSKNNNGQFINPTDYDNTANILYAGNSPGTYFRWLDPATNGASASVTVTEFGGAAVTHVTVSPLTANRVYFGLDNGDVVRVDNANTATTPATGTVVRAGTGEISSIAIDPANEDHMLVTYSNYGLTSIFESNDATSATPTWAAVEGDLPDMPVRWAMFDPRNADWALVATELGVWSTDNLNGASTNWNPTNAGFANVRVDMLQYRSSDRTVAAATHGRGLFTTVIPSVLTPEVSFSSSSATAAEQTAAASGCRSYKDYIINMLIAAPPAVGSTITVNVQAGATATEGVDYAYTTNGNFAAPSNSFVFAANSTTAQPINIRVYDDASVEPAELFTLNYTITGGSAVAGSSNQTYTLNINDNDKAPAASSVITQTIGSGNTSSVTMPFRGEFSDARTQMVYTAAELISAGFKAGNVTDIAFNVATKQSTAAYNNLTVRMKNTTNDSMRAGNVFESGATVVLGPINYSTVAGVNTLTLATPFAWDGASNILIDICFDNAAGTFVDLVTGTTNISKCQFDRANGSTGCSLPIALFQFGNSARPDITFTMNTTQTPVESALTTKSVYLGANTDVYLYSSADGELLARIRNLSAHDYGCTDIIIDRAGTGSSQFWNNNTANYLMNKTFRIVPANNNPAGNFEVTLYFTQAEVNGWQTATGQTFSSIQLIKLPSQISNVTPANPEPDGAGTVQTVTPTLGTIGTHSTITHIFTNGFSGFGAGIPGAPGTLPVTLLSFTGKLQKENVLLEWATSLEQNSRGFEIEKSYDGVSFRKIGFVAAAGNSNNTKHYSFTDPQRAVEFNYYRLRMVDIDNSAKLSDIVLVKNTSGKQEIFITNNPFTDQLNIRFAKIPNDKLLVSLYDMKGSKVYEAEYAAFNQSNLQINTRSRYMASGVYSLRIETGGKTYNLKVVKQ